MLSKQDISYWTLSVTVCEIRNTSQSQPSTIQVSIKHTSTCVGQSTRFHMLKHLCGLPKRSKEETYYVSLR